MLHDRVNTRIVHNAQNLVQVYQVLEYVQQTTSIWKTAKVGLTIVPVHSVYLVT